MGSMQDFITNPYASLKQRTKPNKNLIFVPFPDFSHLYLFISPKGFGSGLFVFD